MRTSRLAPRSGRCGGTRRAAIRSARPAAASPATSTAAPAVQVQGLRQAVQPHQRHHLSRRKLPMRDYLMAIAIFANGAKGMSALELGRDLGRVLQDGVRAGAQAARGDGRRSGRSLSQGDVEIDGAYFGGYVKPANFKENRRDRRLGRAPERQAPGRGRHARAAAAGRYPSWSKSEDQAVATIERRVDKGSTVYADEAPYWDALHAHSRRTASTTARRTRPTRPAPIRPRASSRACAGPRSASTTTSQAPTSSSTRARWRGARTSGAGTTAPCSSGRGGGADPPEEPELVRVLAAGRLTCPPDQRGHQQSLSSQKVPQPRCRFGPCALRATC